MAAVAVVRTVGATLISAAALVFGSAGTAHAHGTHVAPVEPEVRSPRAHHGPFSVLHQGPVAGPFTVLRQAR